MDSDVSLIFQPIREDPWMIDSIGNRGTRPTMTPQEWFGARDFVGSRSERRAESEGQPAACAHYPIERSHLDPFRSCHRKYALEYQGGINEPL